MARSQRKQRRAARGATNASARGRWWTLGALTGLVGGFLVAANGNSNSDDTEIEVGLGVAVGSLLVGGVAGYIERSTVHDARATAFAWYPHDLAERLHLCWTGAAVVPCESVTPGAPPEKPVDPNLDQLRPR